MDQFEEDDTNGSLPILKLRSWSQTPLPLQYYKGASLSPSREFLLLYSQEQEAMLMPLCSTNSSQKVSAFSSARRPPPPPPPFNTSSSLSSPRGESSVSLSQFPELSSPSALQPSLGSFSLTETPATPSTTPAGPRVRIFSSPTTTFSPPELDAYETPYFTPSSTPFWTPLKSPSLRTKEIPPPASALNPKPFPLIADVFSFTWGSISNVNGTISELGLFKELLFIVGSHGLFIHAFCNGKKPKNKFENSSPIAGSPSGKQASAGFPSSDEGYFPSGTGEPRWKNWGIAAVDQPTRQEGKAESCTYGEFRGQVNVAGEKGFLAEAFGTDKQKLVSEYTDEDILKSGQQGFVTFYKDAELQKGMECLELNFLENYCWPSASNVVTYGIPYDSRAFSFLTLFCADDLQINGSIELQSTQDSSKSCTFTELVCSPSHDAVAMFLARRDKDIDTGQRLCGKQGFGTSSLVLICEILEWGIRWISVVNLEKVLPRVTTPHWITFALASNRLFGLQEWGVICIWDTRKGIHVAEINVMQHCGLAVDYGVTQNGEAFDFEQTKGRKQINDINFAVSSEQTSRWQEDEKCHTNDKLVQTCPQEINASETGWMSAPGQLTVTKSFIHRFRQMVVTADCLLVAVADSQGLVYLVSTDEYFCGCSSSSGDSASVTLPSSCLDLKFLSKWAVAGSDIGSQSSNSDLPHRVWLKSFPEDEVRVTGDLNEIKDSFVANRAGMLSFHKQKSHQSTRHYFSSSSSSFVSRADLAKHGMRQRHITRVARRPLRRVFVPMEQNSSDIILCVSPYGITQFIPSTESSQEFHLILNRLHVCGEVCDDKGPEPTFRHGYFCRKQLQNRVKGRVIAFRSQGCLYLLSESALHVVLPPLSINTEQWKGGCQGRWWFTGINSEYLPGVYESALALDNTGKKFRQWQTEVLDRTLIYDGLNEAERISSENGWSVQLVRLRRLQLALDYARSDEMEQALEALVDVGAADAGIPRVIFSALELMLNRFGGDNELGQASRLLALAACFATRLVRQSGMDEWRYRHQGQQNFMKEDKLVSTTLFQRRKASTSLLEMAQFLEVIRRMQNVLHSKRKRPNHGKKETGNEAGQAGLDGIQKNLINVDTQGEGSKEFETEQLFGSDTHSLEKVSVSQDLDSLESAGYLEVGDSWELVKSGNLDEGRSRSRLFLESSRQMFFRWEKEKVDLPDVVLDALRAGRIPLAVVQFHHLHSKALTKEPTLRNAFKKVQGIGRAIVYELFCKGDTSRAMAALCRLGEDIEAVLHDLAFGTVRRYLRSQVTKEMRRLKYLEYQDLQLLEKVSLLERVYPNSSFWGTYGARQRILPSSSTVYESAMPDASLQLHCSSNQIGDFTVDCGDIDGVILGSWSFGNEHENMDSILQEFAAGYWAGAAVWLTAWDQQTLHQVLLDQPLSLGDYIPWEAFLQYQVSCNNWAEVSNLLDSIPNTILQEGELHVRLDCSDSLDLRASTMCVSNNTKNTHVGEPKLVWTGLEVDAVEMVLPRIKVLAVPLGNACTGWMWQMMEEKLAGSLVFLRTYWFGTRELVSLLSRAGLLCGGTGKRYRNNRPAAGFGQFEFVKTPKNFLLHNDTLRAIHELVVRHCIRNMLPNFMALYLDHHSLALDNVSAVMMQAVVGDCQWALWLLLSRIRGREYDASFANARSILAPNFTHGCTPGALDVDEFILTVDDMAEAGGEIMALSTLMYAPVALQKCLCTGSVNRHDGPSWQCTLENLRPGLQHFPTLWRALVAACFSQDTWCLTTGSPVKAANMIAGKAGLTGYLKWRENLFLSACGDTSLLLMRPRWLPKSVQRLLQLAVQGPLGGGHAFIQDGSEQFMRFIGSGMAEMDALSWEAALQKNIEEELYASSFEEEGMGVEHHLRRGRSLAAFNCLLSLRAQNLNTQGSIIREHVGKFQRGQVHFSSEVQALLSALTPNEEKLLAVALPLAIMNYENPVVVAACASFLELCGLSATVLRVDVAALCRISEFYKVYEQSELSRGGTSVAAEGMDRANSYRADVAGSLARALADDYKENGLGVFIAKKAVLSGQGVYKGRPSTVLMAILQQLEKASLVEGAKSDGTAGSWLLSGSGDGSKLRALQRESSERWSLVTTFCHTHQLPLSSVYLAALARDNDWVGFLAEAQSEGCPLDLLISVAAKEFTDARLQSHVLIVLKGLQSALQKPSKLEGQSSFMAPSQQENSLGSAHFMHAELFELLAECEHQRHPGKALLAKAKDLRWALLAVVASCFPDVTALSCLTVWLEITAARETSSIKVNDAAAHLAACVGAAVEATNALPNSSRSVDFRYNRKNAKRRRLVLPDKAEMKLEEPLVPSEGPAVNIVSPEISPKFLNSSSKKTSAESEQKSQFWPEGLIHPDGTEEQESLSKMVAILCEQQRFFPLLRAFELFTPSSSLLPFIRFLQAFSQMRLPDASVHLKAFSDRLKEETQHIQNKNGKISTAWITATALSAANTMLTGCPSAYERRCLLQLLAAADFGDGGAAAIRFRRLFWKIQLAEPSLQQGSISVVQGSNLEDDALLSVLEKQGKWEEARSWARQLELSGQHSRAAVHHVTETQAEAMVTEWKEFLWDVPEQRVALWSHCQALFTRHSFPPLQAGRFFLKHAEAVEQEVPPSELHGMLLLALQWLSGSITNSPPYYPLHLLRELETRVWLLAVEMEVEMRERNVHPLALPIHSTLTQGLNQNSIAGSGSASGQVPIDQTASAIAVVDNHLKSSRFKPNDVWSNENKDGGSVQSYQSPNVDAVSPNMISKPKRRSRVYGQHKRIHLDSTDTQDILIGLSPGRRADQRTNNSLQEENVKVEEAVASWDERIGEQEIERAVLSLLEVGQVSAANQLQQKLPPTHAPIETLLVEAAQSIAMLSAPLVKGSVMLSSLRPPVSECLQALNIVDDITSATPLQVLEAITKVCQEGCGRGLCRRIAAIAQVANFLEFPFSEAFEKQPTELLQLLSLKAQDALSEARLLVETHSMPAAGIARILAESFLKGLLAAHRGGYMDSPQREEGPAPLLWRPSDFLMWGQLCQSEPELGHALMRLVISGHDIPHACEVELLILAHHFYMSSACLDGIDVLLALAATRVESYISEGDFASLARLVTGIGNFHSLHFMLDILIENGQLELLLQKRAAVDSVMESSASIRGFRMAILSTLKHFNPHDLDAFAMVYNHFDMKHEMSTLLESRGRRGLEQWLVQHDPEQSEELLEMMRYNVEAAEVYASIDAGNKARWCCAQASLVSLQLRMPDKIWLNLTETNARRLLVEQSRFQEALIVAEAYGINQPAEWVPVLWSQMLHPGWIDQFLVEFVAALPLPASMLMDLARFYRAEVTARGDQLDFSNWLSPGGLPLEWARYLGKSFRCLLKYVRDVRLRVQLATLATGFPDVLDVCMRILDKMPDTAGPLILRKGHGGTYLPLM